MEPTLWPTTRASPQPGGTSPRGLVSRHCETPRNAVQHNESQPEPRPLLPAGRRHRAFTGRDALIEHPELPAANRQVMAQFVAHGFTGAIKAWLADDSVTKQDLVDAAVACAPVWWS